MALPDHLIVGPDDTLVVNLGRNVTPETAARVVAEFREHSPQLVGRIVVVAAEQIAVVQPGQPVMTALGEVLS